MTAPRVLVADLGGVCCTFRPGRRLALLSDTFGLDPDEVHRRIFGSGLAARANVGELTKHDVHQEVCAALGRDLPPDELSSAWASAFEPDEATLAVVDAVRPGLRTALLTNNGPLLRDSLDTHLPSLVDRFDVLLFSCDLGAAKPDSAAFTAAAAALRVAPQEVLFVDDDLDNVEAAREAGWSAVLHTTAQALADHLTDVLGDAASSVHAATTTTTVTTTSIATTTTTTTTTTERSLDEP